jgi:uncharacterized membrane protein
VLVASLGPTSGAYQAVMIVHILAVVVGFGALFVNSVYSVQGRRRGGAEWAAISEANEFVATRVAAMAIYLVPILGIALIGMSNKVYKFSQAWVSTAFLLYLVMLAILLAVVRPSYRKLNGLLRSASPDAGAISAVEKRMASFIGVNHLLVVVVIYLMVVKPGS